MEDPETVAALARELEADLVVFGPEASLAGGAADAEAERGWAGCGCAGTPYQSYTTLMSMCSI
jgi:phosphoribosylamine--glycine ligase